jgi:hypothetical protein
MIKAGARRIIIHRRLSFEIPHDFVIETSHFHHPLLEL